ncbi:5'-nucleosidase [Acinetobacter bouvetii]|nr:5'-nucleosidase [Acinetobacter bouvetii]
MLYACNTEAEMHMSQEFALMMALPNESKGLFEQAGIEVHYSGIGKVNAAFKAFEVIQKTGCKVLLNLGTAGSSHFDAHALVEVTQFVQRDMDVSPLGFAVGVTPMDDDHPAEIRLDSYFQHLPQGICGTGDSFEIGQPKVPCNLVDMEGYAIAKVCKKLGVRLVSVKYITDGANETAHLDWEENLLLGARKLLELYQMVK